MPCVSDKSQRVGTYKKGCSSLTGLSLGCAAEGDVCYVKDGKFSQCRPINRHLPSLWPTVKAIFCGAPLRHLHTPAATHACTLCMRNK